LIKASVFGVKFDIVAVHIAKRLTEPPASNHRFDASAAQISKPADLPFRLEITGHGSLFV